MDNFDQTKPMELPNGTTSLVLGILSISMCYCWFPTGLILAIIGLSMGNKAVSMYNANPGIYSDVSYKNANAGKICSIIGIILGALTLLSTIFTWSTTINMLKNLSNLSDIYNF